MKKKLWKQWRFWLEVVLGLLLLFFMLASFGLSEEVDNINASLKDYGMSYNTENKEIVFDDEEERSDFASETEESSVEESGSISDDEEIDFEESESSESSTEESSEEPFDPASYQVVDYNEWNHDKIEMLKTIQITGKVIQFLKGDSEVNLRVAIDDNYDTVALVSIDIDDYEEVIAEDDNVTIYGLNGGLTSYETTLGSEVTLPALFARKYVVNSYGN